MITKEFRQTVAKIRKKLKWKRRMTKDYEWKRGKKTRVLKLMKGEVRYDI